MLLILIVANFDNFQKWRTKMGFDDVIAYGNGMVLLFYGPSGTGKTMMVQNNSNNIILCLLLIIIIIIIIGK